MKKFIYAFIIVGALTMSSCGPSAEEMKKMQEEATRTFDSLSKAAEKKLAEDLAKNDTVAGKDTAAGKHK
jgi:hypothetical protein